MARGDESPPTSRSPAPRSRDEYRAAEQEAEAAALATRRHEEVMGALKHLWRKLDAVERRLVAAERRAADAPRATAGAPDSDAAIDLKAVASDADLDGPHGDPAIKFDPREKHWSGQSYVGYHFSETTPEYLDATAKALAAAAFMAGKDADERKRKSARYKALDAARARGWAARLRAGWGGAPAAPAANGAAPAQPRPAADDVML